MNIDLTNEEIKALKSILNKLQVKENDGWILYDGKGEPEVPEGMIVEMEYRDGFIERGLPRDYIGWNWEEEENKSDQVVMYRFTEDTRGHG